MKMYWYSVTRFVWRKYTDLIFFSVICAPESTVMLSICTWNCQLNWSFRWKYISKYMYVDSIQWTMVFYFSQMKPCAWTPLLMDSIDSVWTFRVILFPLLLSWAREREREQLLQFCTANKGKIFFVLFYFIPFLLLFKKKNEPWPSTLARALHRIHVFKSFHWWHYYIVLKFHLIYRFKTPIKFENQPSQQ